MPYRDDHLLRSAHTRMFGVEPELVTHAPGRVNIIGEHIDYSGGIVLPIVIDRYAHVAISMSEQPGVIRVHTIELQESLEHPIAKPVEPINHWSSYVLGTIAELREHTPDAFAQTPGLNLTLCSDVPIGAGLSSSAAIEVATARGVCGLLGMKMTPVELAKLCQRAEHRYAGVPCGLMDQAVVAMAPPGALLAFDCRSEQGRVLNRPHGMGLVVIDTGIRHTLSDSAYHDRRAAAQQAAAALGQGSMREAYEMRTSTLSAAMPPALKGAAVHALSEMCRVDKSIKAIQRGDLATLGDLLNESHRSLRDTLQVSCSQADRIVEIAQRTRGVLGSRLIGGGFGGCVLVLTTSDEAPAIATDIIRAMPGDIDASIVLIDAG
ncbi:MAG: galactokinase [Phycisphaerales bacterium]